MQVDRALLGRLRSCLAAAILLCAAVCSAQVVREDLILLDKPDGKPMDIKLKGGTPVKALKRQGFWVELEAGGKNGWAKISTINYSTGSGGPSAIDTGRLGTGNIVSTSAARGLSAKDLLQGKANFDEVEKLEKLSFDLAALPAFRTAGGVQPGGANIALSAAKPASAGKPGAETQKPSQPAGEKKKGEGDDW